MIKLSVIIPVYNQEKLIVRALESIPLRKDVEIIVVNDGSTDSTDMVVRKYIEQNPTKNITYIPLDKNYGVSKAVNTGLDNATGEYVVNLGSDDYFMDGAIDRAIDWFDGTDLIYFDLIDNNNHIRKLSPDTKNRYVGSTKFMRREFIGDVRCPLERRRAEDTIFNRKLQEKNPTEKYSHEILKYYNYPRVGSLTWNARHGVTDRTGHPIKK